MNTLKVSTEKNISIVQLNRASSNPLNLESFVELIATFKHLETEPQTKAVVLTGKNNFFSAGLDVIELYAYDAAKIEKLFDTLFEAMRVLISFPKPLIAAINGHCPAGGCVLTICADYRIMAEGKYRIGLNEIPVGIIMPQYIYETYAYWLGRGKAAQFILEGKLFTNQEALEVGLVDALYAQENILDKAIEKANFYAQFNFNTWSKSKLLMREDLLKHFEVFQAKLKQDLLQQWWSQDSRTILATLVDKLSNKKQ